LVCSCCPLRGPMAGGRRCSSTRAPSFPLPLGCASQAGPGSAKVSASLSKFYFRGKPTYAREFAMASGGVTPILIITTDRGLVTPETRVERSDLDRFCQVDIASADERYLG